MFVYETFAAALVTRNYTVGIAAIKSIALDVESGATSVMQNLDFSCERLCTYWYTYLSEVHPCI